MIYCNKVASRRVVFTTAAAFSSLIAATVVSGQATDNAPSPAAPDIDDPVVEMSPFEVSADADTGYRATSTLAGSRLRMELKDVAASISVVTKDFMTDLGAKDLNVLLNYTLGTEVNGLAGNMSGASVDGNGFTDFDNNTGLREVQPRARVRGLDIADQTRDYFISSIPTDSYNTERYDISRGANAILFGLGSPAGIINTGIIRANPSRTLTKYELQLDNWGTVRHVLDTNQVILKDKLAVRVAGLYGNQEFKQEPAYVFDKRLTAAITYKPWKSATLRANLETARQKSNRPQNRPPFDYITWWWRVGRPVANASTGVVTMTTTPENAYAAAVNSGGENGSIVQRWGYGNGINIFMTDPYSSTIGQRYTLTNGSTAFVNGALNSPRFQWNNTLRRLGGGWPEYSSAVFARLNQRTANSADDPRFGFWKDPVLTDPSVFDFYNNLLEGPNKREWAFWDTHNITFEQRLGKNAGFELAYDRQKLDSGYENPWNWRDGYALFVDINSVLPNGQANPNFGRPYINNQGWQGSGSEDREAMRATAYYDLDFSKMIEGNAGRWLGRHIFTGILTDQRLELERFSGRPYVSGLDYVQASAAAGYTPSWHTFNLGTGADYRMINRTAYIGGSLANASSASGLGAQGVKASFSIDGQPSISTLWYDPVAAAYTTRTFSVIQSDRYDKRRTQTYGDGKFSKNKIESVALVANSYWLDEMLVTTVGWRNDDYRFKDDGYIDGSGIFQTGYDFDPVTGLARTEPQFLTDHVREGLFPNFGPNPPAGDPLEYKQVGAAGSESTFSYGVIAHLPKNLRGKLPLRSDVSLGYNKSDNFQPTSQRYDINNRPLGAPSGETEDISVRVSSFDGKLELRVAKYESRVENSLLLVDSLREPLNSINRFPRSILGAMGTAQYLDGTNGATAANVQAFDAWMQTPTAQTLFRTYNYVFGTSTANGRPIALTASSRTNEVTGLANSVSEGYEYELTYNPTRNWRITANAAQQEVTFNNIAPELQKFVDDFTKSLVANPTLANTPTGSGAGSQTIGQFANQTRAAFARIFGKEGQPTSEVRKWRFNVVSNYTFSETFLKGINIGGAVRWQDKSAIGYDVKTVTNLDGSRIYLEDLNRPYYGPTETNYDVWIGYNRRIFERFNYKVQLNVRNLGVDDELIPVAAQPDGSIAAYRIAEPMTFTLTNSIEF